LNSCDVPLTLRNLHPWSRQSMVSNLLMSKEAEFQRWLISVLEAERERLLLCKQIPAPSEVLPSGKSQGNPDVE
jgi:hypothetical protein